MIREMLQSDFSQIKILKKIFSKTEFNKRVHIFFTNKITTKCPQKNRTKISRKNHNFIITFSMEIYKSQQTTQKDLQAKYTQKFHEHATIRKRSTKKRKRTVYRHDYIHGKKTTYRKNAKNSKHSRNVWLHYFTHIQKQNEKPEPQAQKRHRIQ